MFKKLVLISCLALSVNAHANCAAVAKSDTEVMKTGKFTYPGYFEVSINNASGATQDYEICKELHSQFEKGAWHSKAVSCYNVTIKSGEGYQTRISDFTHTTYYVHSLAENWIYLDAIMTIRGECSTVAHENKQVSLIRG
jgi:hypothetical protein